MMRLPCSLKLVRLRLFIRPVQESRSVGFKLCENTPDKNILWLSPSEYIFKTQLKNLAAVSDGYQPNNITFMTYAKLANLTDADMAAVNPDFFVIDKFHRGGSEVWGGALVRLLFMHKGVSMFGLTATIVRIGIIGIISETWQKSCLTTACLWRGCSVKRLCADSFSRPNICCPFTPNQVDLERYERKVRSSKRKITRNLAEEYLEKLRRMLNMLSASVRYSKSTLPWWIPQ